MNQRITAAHLHQLDLNQKETLRTQWIPQEGEYIALGDHEEMIYYLGGVEKHKMLPLLTIGQMIEHLYKHEPSFTIQFVSGEWQITLSCNSSLSHTELSHALWAAVKGKL
jgi:hypothetical protein